MTPAAALRRPGSVPLRANRDAVPRTPAIWPPAQARLGAALALATALLAAPALAAPSQDYSVRCASCHDEPADAKVPDTAAVGR